MDSESCFWGVRMGREHCRRRKFCKHKIKKGERGKRARELTAEREEFIEVWGTLDGGKEIKKEGERGGGTKSRDRMSQQKGGFVCS